MIVKVQQPCQRTSMWNKYDAVCLTSTFTLLKSKLFETNKIQLAFEGIFRHLFTGNRNQQAFIVT